MTFFFCQYKTVEVCFKSNFCPFIFVSLPSNIPVIPLLQPLQSGVAKKTVFLSAKAQSVIRPAPDSWIVCRLTVLPTACILPLKVDSAVGVLFPAPGTPGIRGFGNAVLFCSRCLPLIKIKGFNFIRFLLL